MEFYTVKEFAEKLKLCPHTIIRAIKKGKIYAARPSGGKRAPYRIAESELERLQLQAMCETKNDK
jgi:excisionase family DNA binding protein